MISEIKNTIRTIIFEKPRGIKSFPPCYKIHNRANKPQIVVDIGTGATADFSQAMIDAFAATCYGFDPTRKHHQILQTVVEKNKGRFIFSPYAVSATSEPRLFYESADNESGSFSLDHVNIKKDARTPYTVNALTIADLFTIINRQTINILKLDCEGEEYALVQTTKPETLNAIEQLIIEFHHHCIDRFTIQDTLRAVRTLRQFGFKSYSSDAINYLFYK